MPSPDIFPGFPSRERVASSSNKATLIANTIRRGIRNGSLPPHTKLPTGEDGAQALGVTSKTIYRAYDLLKSKGLVEGGRGIGLYIGGAPSEITYPIRKSKQYQRVLSDLVEQLSTGELTTGMLLPSYSELRDMYTVSQGVILSVMRELRRQKLTAGVSGYGTIVSPNVTPDPKRVGRFTVDLDITGKTWEHEVRGRGYKPDLVRGESSVEHPLPFVATRLRIPSTDEVFEYTDLRAIEYPERRMSFDRTTFYFPDREAVQFGIKNPDGTRNVAWNPKDVIGRQSHTISTETPTRAERIAFRIPEGVPFLKNVTTLYTRSDRPFGLAIQVFPGNRGILHGAA